MKKVEPAWGSKAFLEAFRRGDRAQLVELVVRARGMSVAENIAANMLPILEDLAQFALEVRRENVSVIGAHDVFVRHTAHGDLQQVIAPVKLSLGDDTLYQLPVWGKYKPGTDILEEDYDTKGEWKAVIPQHAKGKATITAFGLNVVNKVAGCAIGQPDVVVVDGVERTNPYVERHIGADGRVGDIVRIVLRVNVVGPAPATGNPVIVQYTLDVDPGKDLQHMLLAKVKDEPRSILLIDEADYAAWRETQPKNERWKLLPLYAGVGIAHNLANAEVLKAYAKHVNLLQNALKKAQTVARRNAMRAHPALAFQTVAIDQQGCAVIPVTGWMSSDRNMARYVQLLDRMARGLQPDLDANVINIEEVYDPEEHVVGSASVDANVDEATPSDPCTALLAQIEAGLSLLSPAQLATLAFEPRGQTEAELREVLGAMNRLLDAPAAGGAK